MSYHEKDFQSAFTSWVKANPNMFPTSTAFELKLTKGKSLPFNAVMEHQIIALQKAKGRGVFHKISDMSFGFKPFDAFWLRGAQAYVVIMYYVPQKRHVCYAIDVNIFVEEAQHSKRKSLTEQRAGEIGMLITL